MDNAIWVKDPKCKTCKGKAFNRLPVLSDFGDYGKKIDASGPYAFVYMRRPDPEDVMTAQHLEYGMCSGCEGYYWYNSRPDPAQMILTPKQ